MSNRRSKHEKKLLGCIILDNSLMPKAIDRAHSDDFRDEPNGRIFSAMIELFDEDKKIDIITLTSKLPEIPSAYISSLVDELPKPPNFETYLKTVGARGFGFKLGVDAS